MAHAAAQRTPPRSETFDPAVKRPAPTASRRHKADHPTARIAHRAITAAGCSAF